MAWTKKYEDTYLDKEPEEEENAFISDSDVLSGLIRKSDRTDEEDAQIQKLTTRFLVGSRLPGAPGNAAQNGITTAASVYEEMGAIDTGIDLWTQIADLAQEIGNRDLYYEATDKITNLGPEVYEEHHPGAGVEPSNAPEVQGPDESKNA